MSAAKKPEPPVPPSPRPGSSHRPLSETFDLVRGQLEAQVRDQMGPFGPLLDAVHAYEETLRGELEARLSGRLAEAAGLVATPRVSSRADLARAAALEALRVALASLEGATSAPPVEEAPTAASDETSDEVSGLVATDPPQEPEPASSPRPSPRVVVPEDRPSSPKALTAEEIRAQLAQLASSPRPAVPSVQEGRARERQVLGRLLEQAGPPPELRLGDAAVEDEVDLLSKLSETSEHARWNALGMDTVTHWLAMLVARGRTVRDAVDPKSYTYKVFREAINRLPTYASTRPTGFINGMTPKHMPQHGSWRDDALFHMRELRRVAYPGGEAPAPPPVVVEKAPAAAPAKAKEKEKTEKEVLEWAHRTKVSDMDVLIFGGTPREEARANVERTLGIGELSWPDSDKPRKLDAIVERIRAGKVGAVLILTSYVSHKENDRLVEAARASGTPYALVRGGYGVDAVRRGLEEAFG